MPTFTAYKENAFKFHFSFRIRAHKKVVYYTSEGRNIFEMKPYNPYFLGS